MVVYMVSHNFCMSMNNISIIGSKFMNNRAKKRGGGTLIYSDLSSSRENNCTRRINYLDFDACVWISNTAIFSGALDTTNKMTLTESFPIVPVFKNCKFMYNTISFPFGKAAFMIVCSTVEFEKSVIFRGNSGTALYAIASRIKLVEKMSAKFLKNNGSNGGAISLMSSYLLIGKHSFLNFTNNQAHKFGGAIYSEMLSEYELQQKILSLNCFIQCKHCENVTLLFNNNWGNSREKLPNDDLRFNFGRAIFATSLLSCLQKETIDKIKSNEINLSTALNTLTNFKFFGSNAYDEVVTSAANLTFLKHPVPAIIPGKEFDIPVITKDIFGHKLQSTYKTFVRRRACSGSITSMIDTCICTKAN